MKLNNQTIDSKTHRPIILVDSETSRKITTLLDSTLKCIQTELEQAEKRKRLLTHEF